MLSQQPGPNFKPFFVICFTLKFDHIVQHTTVCFFCLFVCFLIRLETIDETTNSLCSSQFELYTEWL